MQKYLFIYNTTNALKKKNIRIIAMTALLAFSANVRAQVDFTPIFSQIKLEARADFDYYHNTLNNSVLDNPYGFHGRYFNFVIGGPIGDKFSYFFRQRIVAQPGTVSLFDNTDFLYINYQPNPNIMFRFGKDALAVGGCEYDASPIDVLFSTYYWDNFYCFQPAVAMALKSDDGSRMLLAQIANSPYVHYGAQLGYPMGQEWKSGLLSYNLFYTAKVGHFKVLHSINLFERPDHNYMNYIALGHELDFGTWDIYLDFIHHANGWKDWGKNFAIVSCANYQISSDVSIFAKGAYEQNKSNEVLPGFGMTPTAISNGFFDILGEAGHRYATYGLGVEYTPSFCTDFKMHLFLANRQTWYDNNTENSLQANLGITWYMDIHKLAKHAIAKAKAEKN